MKRQIFQILGVFTHICPVNITVIYIFLLIVAVLKTNNIQPFERHNKTK